MARLSRQPKATANQPPARSYVQGVSRPVPEEAHPRGGVFGCPTSRVSVRWPGGFAPMLPCWPLWRRGVSQSI